jgi:hypothetical protein
MTSKSVVELFLYQLSTVSMSSGVRRPVHGSGGCPLARNVKKMGLANAGLQLAHDKMKASSLMEV